MADGLIRADFFELRGEADVTYGLRSGLLHYRGPTRPPLRDFVEVAATSAPLETVLGRLVTATLRAAEDGDASTVTLLLPEVNLDPADEAGARTQAEVHAVVVWTTIQSTIGGPGLVKGPVQLYTVREMEGTARLAGPGSSCTFVAILNMGLPGPDAPPGVLTVDGECTLGTTGYTVELVRHEPQGTNPRDLLLDLVVTPPAPDDIVAPVLTKYPVRYEEATRLYFQTVTVLPDGPSVPVQIIT